MPLIQIRSLKTEKDTESTIENIISNAAENTNFSADRLMVEWSFSENKVIFRKGKKVVKYDDENGIISISITLSKRNSRKDAEDLTLSVVNSVSESLDFDKNKILAVINHMDEGNIFVGGGFV